jgi:hypothetical protein
MAVRPSFVPGRALVAARVLTYLGIEYAKGDPFPKSGIDSLAHRKARIMYDSRRVDFAPEQAVETGPVDPVQIKTKSAGWYEITAPWLDAPVKVKGKVNSDKRADELREAGPPLGWIEGGSVVTVSGGDGGWYDVAAPWLDEPERVQGREAAEARQRELHDAGEPDTHHGFTLTDGENGWYVITGAAMQETLKVHGEEDARAAVAKLRAGELVEGATIITPVEGPAASVLISVEDDRYVVSAPWLEQPESFDTAEAADARQAELREAGPPEGWVPPEAPPAATE